MIKNKMFPLSLILSLIFLSFLVTVSLALESSAPTVTTFSPVNGANISSANATITFEVSDPDLISNSSGTYYIKVNGTERSSNFEYTRGYWEEDTCSGGSFFIVTGYDLAKVSAYVTGLKDGANTIEAKATDRLGNAVVKTWTVNVAGVAPTYSNMNPANGTTTGNNTTLTVKVSDNSQVDPSSIVLQIDGNQVNHTFDAVAGTVSYTSPAPLADGLHTIKVTAMDMTGNQSSTTWSYTVKTVGPDLTFADAGKTFTTPNVSLSTWAKSAVKLAGTGHVMKIDGVTIPNTFTYKGHWYYPPYAPSGYEQWIIDSYYEGSIAGNPTNLKDGNHTLAVTAKDELGNSATNQWNFIIQSKPVFTAPNPANGASTGINSGFSVKVTDNDAIDQASIIVKLDSIQAPAVFDSSTGVISYQPVGGLTNGTHTVSVSLKDTTGNLSTYSWSFTVQATGPEVTFADAGKIFDTHKPTVTIAIKSNVQLSSTANVIKVDGQVVPAAFSYKGHWYSPPYSPAGYYEWVVDSYNEGTLTYTPVSIADGQHELIVTAKDNLGNATTKTFNFAIAQKPVITGLAPANGSTVTIKTPVISAEVADPNGPALDEASIKLLVNNNQVTPIVAEANGKITVSYNASLSDDAFHNVSLTAADTVGNTATSTWKFYINTKGEMAVTSQGCGTCHAVNQYNKYSHRLAPDDALRGSGGTCGHCHRSYEPQFCGYCHGGNPWDIYFGQAAADPGFQSDKQCTFCHTNTPNVYAGRSGNSMVQRQVNIGVGTPDLLTWNLLKHNLMPSHNINKGTCNNCHSIYLTREHNRENSQGVQLTCTTCHKSNDPKVQQAIAAKNKDCTACHDNADHEALHNSGLDSNCLTCHNAALTQEHFNNTKTTAGKGYTCDTCHASTDKAVVRTIDADKVNCAGCHNEAHKVYIVDKVPDDMPLYPGYQWTTPMEVSVFAGEQFTPTGYEKGQVVLSNRRTDVTLQQAWNFFNEQLAAKGWIFKSGAPAELTTRFNAEFTKNNRAVTVRFYNTGLSDGTGQIVASGYRTEVWYK